MNIQILHLIEGAKQAKGVTVVIDVFRAFSVEAYLMEGGAETIYPVGSIDFAYQYKKDHPEILLVGERHGVMCEGFDLGNSPTQAVETDVRGKTILHTTSAGTQGIANATNADVVLTGSLVNAKAIARYIKALNPTDVSLVCMGLEAVEPSEEDTMCAEYIKDFDSTEEIAGDLLGYVFDDGEMFAYGELLSRVTQADAERLLREVFDPTNVCMAVIVPLTNK